MPVVINSGDEPAVLERIEPVDPTPGLRLVHTRIARIGTQVPLVRLRPLARSEPLHRPASRARLRGPPGDVAGWDRGAELIFVLRADSPGRYKFKAVAVEYRVGGKEHRAVLDIGLGVCVTKGRKMPDKRCNDPPTDLDTSRES